jgi:hypothetical protein
MKKLIIAATILSVATVGTQNVKAGDCGWNTAGQVLAGVAVGAVIASAVNCNGGNVSVSYSYGAPACPPPAQVVYAPAPVIYAPAPVVYVPRPVVCAPRPVVCAPQPVVYAPYRPAVCPPQAAWGYGHGNKNGHAYGYQKWGGQQYYARR